MRVSSSDSAVRSLPVLDEAEPVTEAEAEEEEEEDAVEEAEVVEVLNVSSMKE